MPIYEYECNDCGHRTELLQRLSDPPLASCPECGGSVRKLLSPPAVQFKGSGWYVTDYAGKGKSPSGEGKKASDEGKAAKAGDGGGKAAADGKSSSKASDSKGSGAAD